MSSGFITEAEVEKRKQLRQEEWERVRKPEEPLEAPEEALHDTRPLYDRLQEQKNKKQDEYEESHKLKNLVKVLDDDEVDFLDFVDRAKLEDEKRKRIEEAKELSEFRSEVSKLREEELQKHILNEIGLVSSTKPKVQSQDLSFGIGSNKTSQTKLLAGIVKRKASTTNSNGGEKQAEIPSKISKPDNKNSTIMNNAPSVATNPIVENNKSPPPPASKIESVPYKGNLVCIGVLPGLASYSNSSDSDDDILDNVNKDSSDSDEGGPALSRDLCGRRIAEYDKDKDH